MSQPFLTRMVDTDMQTKEVLRNLKDALQAARMESCGFTLPGRPYFNQEDTPAIVEATRLYRESWIIGPIERAIAEIERSQPKPKR